MHRFIAVCVTACYIKGVEIMAGNTALPLVLLAEQFAKLPGIGMKTAQRLAYYVMSMTDEEAKAFSDAIIHAHSTVKACSICQNLTDNDVCPVCSDDRRDQAQSALLKLLRMFQLLRELTNIRAFIMFCTGLFHLLTE